MSTSIPQPRRRGPVYPHEVQFRRAALSGPLKRQAKPTAQVRRVSLVPTDITPSKVNIRGDLVMPPNDGITDLNVSNHGGPIAPGIPVQLIFWGTSWTSGPASQLANQLVKAIALLLAGPYYSGLKQYGIDNPPVLRNSALVATPDPGSTFDDNSIADLVWNLAEQNFFPEPEDSNGRVAYVVMPHEGSAYEPGHALGAHSQLIGYDFPFDTHPALTAWIGFADIHTMTRAFGHQIAQLCTDPSGDAWHTDNSHLEIGDICSTRRGFLNGIFVEGYWSKGAKACVLRQSWGFNVSAVSRHQNQIDIFVTENNGVVNTSWWSVRQDWSGVGNRWRPIGGTFPVGAPVTAVARNPNQIDLFIVGNDGAVYTSWWSTGQDWSGIGNHWRSIGGVFPVGARVTAVARRSNQLDLFIVGNDGVVYTSWWAAGEDWSGLRCWRAIGGVFPTGAEIAAVARSSEHLDLFITGSDGNVYTSWWTASQDWSGIANRWRDIGGNFPPGTPVTAVRRDANRVDLFVVGFDGGVYTSWWTARGDWSGLANRWRPIGGMFPINARVTAVARNPNQLDLFIVGNDGVVYTSQWTAGQGWSGLKGWFPIGGVFPVGAPVSAVVRHPGHLDLFVLGNNGVVHTSGLADGQDWSAIGNRWRPIGGMFPVGV